nr:hypothetical protein [Burkholderia sp. BCC1977]
MSGCAVAPWAAARCLMLAARRTEAAQPSVPPSPETASIPAASPAVPIRGIGFAPHLAGPSHWAVGQCTSNGALKVCN